MIKIIAVIFLTIVIGRGVVVELVKDKRPNNEALIIGLSAGSNTNVQETQRILKDGGFYAGLADGFMGTETREAIKAFQKKSRIRSDGKIDAVTWEKLKAFKMVENRAVAAQGTVRREFIEKEGGLTSSAVYWMEEPGDRVKQIQSVLKNIGYYAGKVDGKNGPKTRRALKAFQLSNGLKGDGMAGKKTMEALRKHTK